MIRHYCGNFDGNGNDSFNYLADLFAKNGIEVELVTSVFWHGKKVRRADVALNLPYKVTFIDEPGYKKNVDPMRLYSSYIMGRNLAKYLEKRKRPDGIYCVIPSLDVGYAVAKYAKKNNVPLIIAVHDLWPEVFQMAVNIPPLFYPLKKKADFVYSAADEIIAVSETYANRALSVNKKVKQTHSVYQGTDLSYFDSFPAAEKTDEIKIAYCGTLGHSYDIPALLDAMRIIGDKAKLIIMGSGPLKEKFEEYAKGTNTVFTGSLPYGEMVSTLKSCDIAVNVIVKSSLASIINKHGDYAASGLPVVNSQPTAEYRELIEKYNAGLNCECENSKDIAEKLLILIENKELRLKLGRNHRRLAEERFDRAKTYNKIVEVVKKI